MQTRYKTLKFVFGGYILATLAALTVLCGPYAALYFFFHPIGFYQKAIFFFLTIGGLFPLVLLAFGTWVLVASRFE